MLSKLLKLSANFRAQTLLSCPVSHFLKLLLQKQLSMLRRILHPLSVGKHLLAWRDYIGFIVVRRSLISRIEASDRINVISEPFHPIGL
ncbi:hypothetical protein D3C80_2088690 [compost metagenome]